MRVVVTGGAGFIGRAVVAALLRQNHVVYVVDKLTYAGNLDNLEEFNGDKDFHFLRGDITCPMIWDSIFIHERPDAIIHLAAESHVDNSISSPQAFLDTNVGGTYCILEGVRKYLDNKPDLKHTFRMIHVSTDEVFGSLGLADRPFDEKTAYNPSSPYSATKAASDHLVRAWHRTYGIPAIVTNCTNNYGPYQFPEKFMPKMMLAAIKGDLMFLYGNGQNVRDWIHVDDHADAIVTVLNKGLPGQTYCIGSQSERTNFWVACLIGDLAQRFLGPNIDGTPRGANNLIRYVTDRPGHDLRYGINPHWIRNALGWKPKKDFVAGMAETFQWYLSEQHRWVHRVKDGSYRRGL